MTRGGAMFLGALGGYNAAVLGAGASVAQGRLVGVGALIVIGALWSAREPQT